MGTNCLTSSPASFSSSSTLAGKIQTRLPTRILNYAGFAAQSFLPLRVSLSASNSCEPFACSSSSSNPNKIRLSSIFVVANEERLVATTSAGDANGEDDDIKGDSDSKTLLRPSKLYVCNLPRSCDISELFAMFKPYGTVQSVEISRNAETGISRGCGTVTMSSREEAKDAIAALDGSDVGGREMRVRFSFEMNRRGTSYEPRRPAPRKTLILESPYKVFVGNLAWSVKSENLKSLFSQFGTVVSARVLYDRDNGKNRVYGFVSFSSPAECEAAMSLNGTEHFGRTLRIRNDSKKTEP